MPQKKHYPETSYHVTVYEEVTQPWEEGDDEPEHETTVHHKDDYTSMGAVIDAVKDNSWLEWSSSRPSDGDWLTTEDEQDYRTGETTRYELFVKRNDGKPKTQNEIDQLDTLRMGSRHKRYKGGDVPHVQRGKKGLSSAEYLPAGGHGTIENPVTGTIRRPTKSTALTRRQLRLPGVTRGRG